MPEQLRRCPSQQRVLEWARTKIDVKEIERIRNLPWAQTYKLIGESQTWYLKVLPPQQQPALKTIPILAAHFSGRVPRVIASNHEMGALLHANHHGQELGRHPTDDQLRSMLVTYASMQIDAVNIPELLTYLPRPRLAKLVSCTLAFLDPAKPAQNISDSGPTVNAAYFLGDLESGGYYQALLKRRSLLDEIVALHSELPVTLNHCDLRSRNVAAVDGRCVLYDWDDAVAGPAGLSLHATFSGCFGPIQFLRDVSRRSELINADSRLKFFQAYIDELVDGGYAERQTLIRCLPASICAGVMLYLLSFSSFPMDSKTYRASVAKNLSKRLSDLLDLCDFMSLNDRNTALEFALDYQDNQRPWRADRILRRYLRRHTSDAGIRGALGSVQLDRGRVSKAIDNLNKALQAEPDNASFCRDLGFALLQKLQVEDASRKLEYAIRLNPSDSVARQYLDRSRAVAEFADQAGSSGGIPTLSVSSDEFERGALNPEKLKIAPILFAEYGVLLIKNAFSRNLIESIKHYFLKHYASYFQDKNHAQALRVGDKRFMISLDFDGPFNARELYASPLVYSVVKQILGEKAILGSFTSVTSLPGSNSQSVHKDHPALFVDPPAPGPVPSFATTLIVPLVDLNELTGSTRVIKGSHLASSDQTKGMAYQDPLIEIGSCLLMDYRLSHQGQPNNSEEVRPILSLVYQKPWFRDCVNYTKQPPLKMTRKGYQQVPDKYKYLFSWLDINLLND